nr:hypothetical protein [Oceanococcus sp. HetDA_MAG_MS8]
MTPDTVSTNADDLRPLLQQLLHTLEEEQVVLDTESATDLHPVIERKDALCQQLSLFTQGHDMSMLMDADTLDLLQRCQQLNLRNGGHIDQRRAEVRNRMSQMNPDSTYNAHGQFGGGSGQRDFARV